MNINNWDKFIKENNNNIIITDEIAAEVRKFNTSEELLRSGGISIEALDRAAFGFSSEDIKTLMPNQLHIKWKVDLQNVKDEIISIQNKNKLSFKEVAYTWSKSVDLTEPIDVSYDKGKFFIEDGHHRYYAAKTLGKLLNIDLQIKSNPMKKIASSLSYDDFHRYIFDKVSKMS